LVPEPAGAATFDRINREYPDLWAQGGVGMSPVGAFELDPQESVIWSWKLYRVDDTRPGAAGRQAAAQPEAAVIVEIPEECFWGSRGA
jgi:hypothetical protein